jgi:hypothetical protein
MLAAGGSRYAVRNRGECDRPGGMSVALNPAARCILSACHVCRIESRPIAPHERPTLKRGLLLNFSESRLVDGIKRVSP